MATAALGVRSLFIMDAAKMYWADRYWCISTDPGTIAFARQEFTFEWPGKSDSWFRYYGRRYGVRYSHGSSQRIQYQRTWDLSWAIGYAVHTQHDSIVALPLWPALAAFAYLPVRTAIRRRREQRRGKRNFCRACGYDLRARRSAARNAEPHRTGAIKQPHEPCPSTSPKPLRDARGKSTSLLAG